MKKLSKKQEIILIEKLRDGEGYFADMFDKMQSNIMIANILNDFPLLHNTELHTAVHNKDSKIKELNDQLKTKDDSLFKANIMNSDKNTEIGILKQRLYQILLKILDKDTQYLSFPESAFTEHEIIEAKINVGLPLTFNEVKIIKEALNK